MPSDRILTGAIPLIKYSICGGCEMLDGENCNGDVEVFPFFSGICRNRKTKKINESKLYDYVIDFFKAIEVYQPLLDLKKIYKSTMSKSLNISSYLSKDLKQVWDSHLRKEILNIKPNRRYYLFTFMKNKLREMIRA